MNEIETPRGVAVAVPRSRTTCPDCQTERETPPRNPDRRAIRLERLEEVLAHANQGRRPSDDQLKHRHAAHVDGIRARYKLPHPIQCEMPDKTMHNIGYVVDTRCGLTIKVGHECAKRDIDGIDEALLHVNALEAWDQDVAQLATIELLAKKAFAIADEAATQRAYVSAVRKYLPAIHGEMITRASKAARGIEVVGTDPNGQPTRGQLVGLELWDGVPTMHRGAVDVLLADVIAAIANGPPPPEDAHLLARRMRGVRTEVLRVERFLEGSRRFFGPRNIELVIVAVPRGHSVGPSGGIVFRSRESGNWRELRSDGKLYALPNGVP